MNEPSPPLAEASDMQLVTTRFASLAPLPGRFMLPLQTFLPEQFMRSQKRRISRRCGFCSYSAG